MMLIIESKHEEQILKIRDFLLSIVEDPKNVDLDIKDRLSFIECFDKKVGSYFTRDYKNNCYIHVYDRKKNGVSINVSLDIVDSYWG